MILLSYLTLYVIWGSTYLFIGMAVETLPPFYIVGIRFFLGGAGLLAASLFSGRLHGALLTPARIASSILIGLLLLVGGNGLVTLGQRTIDSHMAALIVSATPLVVAVYDRILLRSRISWWSLSGIILGLTGVGFLMSRGATQGVRIDPAALFICGAVLLWGLGTSLSKRLPLPSDSLANAGVQLTCVGVVCIVALQIVQPVTTVDWGSVSPRSWFALGYLTVFGSAALAAFMYLLEREPNHRVVSYAFVNPLVAVLLGVFLGKEHPSPAVVPGGAMILGALGLMFYGEKLFSRRNS